MKVLEGNNYCRCTRCHSFLQYAPDDIKTKCETTLKIFKTYYDIVMCPVCKTEITMD